MGVAEAAGVGQTVPAGIKGAAEEAAEGTIEDGIAEGSVELICGYLVIVTRVLIIKVAQDRFIIE